MTVYTVSINAVFAILIAAAKLAHCDEFAEKLSDGWNTVIGENGSNFPAERDREFRLPEPFEGCTDYSFR